MTQTAIPSPAASAPRRWLRPRRPIPRIGWVLLGVTLLVCSGTVLSVLLRDPADRTPTREPHFVVQTPGFFQVPGHAGAVIAAPFVVDGKRPRWMVVDVRDQGAILATSIERVHERVPYSDTLVLWRGTLTVRLAGKAALETVQFQVTESRVGQPPEYTLKLDYDGVWRGHTVFRDEVPVSGFRPVLRSWTIGGPGPGNRTSDPELWDPVMTFIREYEGMEASA